MKNPLKTISSKALLMKTKKDIAKIEKEQGLDAAKATLKTMIITEMYMISIKNPSWDAEKLASYDDDMLEFCSSYGIEHKDILGWAREVNK